MSDTWPRIGLGYLALVDLVTGLWSVLDPSGWYRRFPGLGRHWVAATPPYNHHLAIDSGAGFLGVGVVLAVALLWRERRIVQAALLGSLAHDVPHFLYHLLHPAHALSASDKAISTGGLAFGCVLAAGLLVWVSRSPAPTTVAPRS